MKRDITGRYVVQTTQGETVRAFVPHPLPPDPPIQWTPGLLAAQPLTVLGITVGLITLNASVVFGLARALRWVARD